MLSSEGPNQKMCSASIDQMEELLSRTSKLKTFFAKEHTVSTMKFGGNSSGPKNQENHCYDHLLGSFLQDELFIGKDTAEKSMGIKCGIPDFGTDEGYTRGLGNGEILEVQEADVNKIAINRFFKFKIQNSIQSKIFLGYLFPHEGRRIWLQFQYDRLPYMCFNCRRIGHEMRQCTDPRATGIQEDGVERPNYGSWLKIDSTGRTAIKNNTETNQSHPEGIQGNSNSYPPQMAEKRIAEERDSLLIIKSQGDLPMEQGNRGLRKRLGEDDHTETYMNHMGGRTCKARTMEAEFGNTGLENNLFEVPISYDGGSNNKQKGTREKRRKFVTRKGNRQTKTHDSGEDGKNQNNGKMGLGNPWTVTTLATHVKDYNPGLVFLSETRSKSSYMESIRIRLGYEGCFCVDAKGKSGGLALLWKTPFTVQLNSFNAYHIDAWINTDEDLTWRFTGFYRDPDHSQRKHSWQLLRRLAENNNGPWLCGGDFNEIRAIHEKLGGGGKPGYLMKNFNNAIDRCALREIEYEGNKFTWCNGRATNMVFERLDRVMVNNSWWQIYAIAKVKHLSRWCSDHSPLLVTFNTMPCDAKTQQRWGHRFHYEKAWADKEECYQIVKDTWKEATHIGSPADLNDRINICGTLLDQWNTIQRKTNQAKIKELKKEVEKWSRDHTSHEFAKLKERERDLNGHLEKEELFWKQRSRAIWLSHGDRNTKYFHQKATSRRKKNRIKGLFDKNLQWMNTKENIERTICDHFQELFSALNHEENTIANIQSFVPLRLSRHQNEILFAEFTANDIQVALSQINALKAPKIDGMSRIFYENHWEIIGEDVTRVCLEILNYHGDCRQINKTLLCLIP
uniref:CCHC-type domain-containing protein n=1 Tax=Cannabis sativa TaxID=3483 RepID=A0A803NGK6_CANSA